jgi:hypothetical protein
MKTCGFRIEPTAGNPTPFLFLKMLFIFNRVKNNRADLT